MGSLQKNTDNESPIVLVDKNGFPLTQAQQERVLEQVTSLPASQPSIVDDYLRMIREHPISIIKAETGAGKTTQIPKNIRLAMGLRVNVTQPRVLSAISNAKRVSEELLAQELKEKYTLNYGEVGYRVASEAGVKKTSMLSFNTGGLELMRQFHSGLVPDILFLDEIQGMGVDLEILMWLFKTRKDLSKRLIIMSATLEPEVFRDYFGNQFGEIPLLEIPGRTFPVERFHHPSKDLLIPKTLDLLSEGKSGLIFVSGKGEIYDMIQNLKEGGVEVPIYPLHAELTEQEQMQAVINTEREQRLIVATNVAEESITPEGIQFVCDMGTHKMSYPNSLGIEELVRDNTSKANSEQRAGRAGRIEEGEYHRFHSDGVDEIDPYPVPPITRNMLDREILLFLKSGRDLAKLNKKSKEKGETLFTHEINTSNLPISYERLRQVGAIGEDGKITELGEDMLSLNLDVYHARMLLQAIGEGCIDEMIYMVCIVSAKGFLGTDETWKELFTSTSNKQTDLIYYMKMLGNFTSRKLPRSYTDKLAGLGVHYEELQAFNDQTGPVGQRKMLFEMVDLSPLGVKNHKIAEIHNLIFVIRKRLESQGVALKNSNPSNIKEISQNGKQASIQTCLHAGYPFFASEYDEKKKRFTSRVKVGGIGDLEFQPTKTSLVIPTVGKQYSYYPFIIELDGDETPNLNLASFISIVPAGAEKSVIEYAENYSSPFDKKITGAQSKQSAELEKEYLTLIQDVNKIQTVEEFLENVLPLLVMIYNHKFKKFIEKNPGKVNELQQRLSRFFKNNRGIYKHRVTLKDISKTERSFRDDTAIHDNFRDWETSFVREGKQRKKAAGRLSPKERNDAREQLTLSKLKTEFITLAGEYRSGKYNVDTRPITSQVIRRVFEEYMESSSGLNGITTFEQENIYSLREEEVKQTSRKLSYRSKQKRAIKKIHQYIRYLGNIVQELEALLDGEDVDQDFLKGFEESRFFKKNSKSQKSKYKSALIKVCSYPNIYTGSDLSQERKYGTAKNQIRQFINTISAEIENNKLEVENYKDDFENYISVPQASELEQLIYTFLREIFSEDYTHEHFSPEEVGKIIAEIYRNSIGKEYEAQEILEKFFVYHDHTKHIQHPDIAEFYSALREYNDTKYSIETSYTSDANYKAIKADGQEGISQAIEELQIKLERIGTARRKLVSFKK